MTFFSPQGYLQSPGGSETDEGELLLGALLATPFLRTAALLDNKGTKQQSRKAKCMLVHSGS